MKRPFKTPIYIALASDGVILVGADHELIGKLHSATDQEVAELVRRVNAHPKLVEALESLLAVLNDRNAPGTNVDGRWMGVPDWEVVDAATVALKEAGQ